MFEWLLTIEGWVSLLTLTALEIVLGVDNVIFISILAGKMPTPEQQHKARQLGLAMALVTRIALLMSIAWLAGLTADLFEIPAVLNMKEPIGISGRDLILLVGGLFLLAKSTMEIHHKLEGEEGSVSAKTGPSLASVVVQIMLLDIVFSLDSVITAVGMVKEVSIMVAAVVVAMGFMLAFAGRLSRFIDAHPSLKILALSFLLLIGCLLVAESLDAHIPKGYVYFAMAFSVGVEILNIRQRNKQAARKAAVHLREPVVP